MNEMPIEAVHAQALARRAAIERGPAYEVKGHLWKFTGREDASSWEPHQRQWARSVYTCQRCHHETKIFGTNPNTWAANDRRCPNARFRPPVNWWIPAIVVAGAFFGLLLALLIGWNTDAGTLGGAVVGGGVMFLVARRVEDERDRRAGLR